MAARARTGAANVGASVISALLAAGLLLPAPAEAAVAVLGNPSVDFSAAAACIACIVLFTVMFEEGLHRVCLLYTSPSPRDATLSRMPSSA